MTNFEIGSVIIAGLSMLISVIAIFMAGKASNLNKKMFKRQGVIELHMAWQDVNNIDSTNIIGPDVIKAVNAMSLTASLWNHDVIEKSILYQSYWNSYRDLHDKLVNIDVLIPGHKKTCRSLITNEIKKAYKGMNETDLSAVIQTNL